MATPDLQALRDLAGPVLGAWARSIEQSAALTPIRAAVVDGAAVVLDHAIWVEDTAGGRLVRSPPACH